MGLQFIIGGAGTGKSTTAFDQLIKESMEEPGNQFYCIVPEQFTMAAQKTLAGLHPGGGILNIDVLSFQRLAYRILEETGGDTRQILEDTGKSMVIEKIVQERKKDLPYLGNQMHRPGCLDEVKSLISEFMQYGIKKEETDRMRETVPSGSLLWYKMNDIASIYEGFCEYLGEHYVTSEEVLDVLLKQLPLSERIKGSTMVFDGFTGFTPIQEAIIRELLRLCRSVRVTVTMDPEEPVKGPGKLHQLFYMSHEMIWRLSRLTDKIEKPMLLGLGEEEAAGTMDQAGSSPSVKGRFGNAPALAFLEKNLFRYHKKVYDKEQDQIRIFAADTPMAEMEDTANRIRRLVRTKGFHYGEIAVITGNLEIYGDIAEQIFHEAGIPFFVDKKHSVMMNPFVESIRAVLEMVTQNFSYESVMRYFHTGFSCLSMTEADLVDNYIRALGIRGKKKWSEKWTRLYRGLDPARIPELDNMRNTLMEAVLPLAEVFSSGKKTVRTYCEALFCFLSGQQAEKKCADAGKAFAAAGKPELEKEYSQIYELFIGLIDKMVSVLGDDKVTRQEFRQLLEMGIGQLEIGLIPPSLDQVLVGDMERSRLGEIKALFFVGVNEGSIPKSTGSGGFLTEMDRDYFADKGFFLAPGPKEQIAIGKYYLYLNLTKPSCYLTLSYSRANNSGEPLRPAYLATQVQELFPHPCLYRETAAEPELPMGSLSCFTMGLRKGAESLSDPLFLELYRWYLRSEKYEPIARNLVKAACTVRPRDIIGRAASKALYGEISPYSATRLERYCACAFSHFLTYGLNLSERMEYEFRSLDLGNVMHQALERFARRLDAEGMKWKEVGDEYRERVLEECVDEAAADYGNGILHSSARDRYRIERIKRILKKTVWVLQEQLKYGEFEPDSFELSFEGGRIDRVDISREGNFIYVKVVDYKTGSTHFSLEKIAYGLQLQLVLYMDAALAAEGEKNGGCEIIPAGLFYYRIQDPILEARDGNEKDILVSSLKMDGLVSAQKDVIDRLDRSGRSLPVTWNKDGTISQRSAQNVATREQFAVLSRFVRAKIDGFLTEIKEGNCLAEPYRLGKESGCDYCAFRSVCGFDTRIPGYTFKSMKSLTPNEAWAKMEQEEASWQSNGQQTSKK